jgi:hypothetical protein
MKKPSLKKLDVIILAVILFVALILRLYKIDTPLADLHSWRQVDTAAVARNFVRNGFDLMSPRYDDLSNTQSGLENPHGYRFVEFPLYNAMFAFTSKIIPGVPLEIHGRLTTVFFSLIIIAILYYLAFRESDRITAIVTACTYAIFPFFVFFSRVIFPETTALAFVFMAIFFLYISFQKKGLFYWFLFFLSLLSFSLSLLMKPTVIFYGITLVYLFFHYYKFSTFKNFKPYLYFIAGCIPFLLWRNYISKFPEGVPANQWLITSVNTFEGQKNIFMKPAFFRWIFFERLNNIILGGFLTVLFILGLIKKQANLFFLSIFVSSLSYLFVFQGGNVQHEYYQTLILPAVALAIGCGVSFLIKNVKTTIHPAILYAVLVTIMASSFFFSYYKVRDYYNYPSELPQIAKIVQTLTDSHDKIITDRLGDTTFLYLIDRKGSASIYKDLEEMKKNGYKYLVTMNQDTIKNVKSKYAYRVVFENSTFTLFEL